MAFREGPSESFAGVVRASSSPSSISSSSGSSSSSSFGVACPDGTASGISSSEGSSICGVGVPELDLAIFPVTVYKKTIYTVYGGNNSSPSTAASPTSSHQNNKHSRSPNSHRFPLF